MSFLSIAFLAALPLAAAPILLHLFDRRRNVVIQWGAMQFLMEAATRRTSARKLKQWLLLLLRVLAVTALVLAMARPMLPGSWFGTSQRGETVLVIDNSMSMLRKSGDTTLFEAAIARAVALLEEINTGDSVRVLLSSPYPAWASGGSVRVDTASRKIVADQLRQLRPTHGRSDLLAALFTAVQAEVEPTQRYRRIVLLSDGQSADWNLADDAPWKRFREVLETAAVPTQLDVMELEASGGQPRNLAVSGIESNRTTVGVGQPFTLTARIQNHGQHPSSPCSATWHVQREEQYAGHVPALDGGQVRDVVWKHSLDKAGVYAISCQIDAADELLPDNEATVVIEVVEKVPVVVLEGAADLAELQQDSFFFQAALGWMHGEPLGQRGIYVPLAVDPDRLQRLHLQDYHAAVVPNLTALDEGVVAELEEFVAGGGGLWIGLGPRTDIEAFNQHFFADGNGLAPLAIDRIVDEEVPRDEKPAAPSQTRIDAFASKHPATVELKDSGRLDTGAVAISRRFRFVAPAEGEDVSVLLSLTNGQPLVVEKLVGRGRVIVQSIPLRMEWSDLVRSQAFVVLVRNWLDYLTQPLATRHNLAPGEPIALQIANTEHREATLRTPHGDEIELSGDLTGEGVLFRSSRTILPGDYWLEPGLSGESIAFHVNRDPVESDLAPLSAAERRQVAETVGLSRHPSQRNMSGTSHRDPLWPVLLMILIGVIAAELVLCGVIARERFGSEPIPETSEPWNAQRMGMPGSSDNNASSARASPAREPTRREHADARV